MAVRYFRNATNVLVERTEIDAETPATGLTAVTKAAIEVVYSGTILLGGTFDNVAYAPPAGQPAVDDLATDTGKLRAACRGTHQQLYIWRDGLLLEGEAHDFDDVSLGLTYLARAHEWNYLVAHNHRLTGNAAWTAAERITAIQLLAQGASDVTSPFTFFQRLHPTAGAIVKPTGPCGWVNVNTGMRVTLSTAISTTGTMNLDVTQLPDESIRSGAWIESVEA